MRLVKNVIIELVCRDNRLLLVKCYDNKKVKSPFNWVISPLTQPQVAYQQKRKEKVFEYKCFRVVFRSKLIK